jgi:acyl-CoA thioesterase-1
MRRREFIILAGAAAATWLPPTALCSEERVIKIVVLGDALASGYYLPVGRRFSDRLEFALKAKGQSVTVVDASWGNDTAARGLARSNRSIPEDTDAAILELGAVDMVFGVEPTITRTSLAAIIENLKARRLPCFFAEQRLTPTWTTNTRGPLRPCSPVLPASTMCYSTLHLMMRL